MLPFLKPEKMASVIVARRKSDGSQRIEHEEGEHPPELMAAAEALIRALNSKSAKDVASAIKDCIDCCGSSAPAAPRGLNSTED